jgi:hypothetical protein
MHKADDAYAPQPPVTVAEVMTACEILLRAGFTAEALAVLAVITGKRLPCG